MIANVTTLSLNSMGDAYLMRGIAERLLKGVTSLGLNEQELVFLARVMGGMDGAESDFMPCRSSYGSHLVFLGPHQSELQGVMQVPPVWLVSDLIDWIFATYGTLKLWEVFSCCLIVGVA